MSTNEDPRETARRLLLNGETASFVAVAQEEETGATPLYLLVLDEGWKQSIVASRMYRDDARGLAYALADVLDCPVEDLKAEED